ncbi:MAG TPA: VWA domain-containing protein [Candidatus Acidoferrales bacterium]|nr:VWA domain-containing protein [Candidatus Acidoferrales bacterium]
MLPRIKVSKPLARSSERLVRVATVASLLALLAAAALISQDAPQKPNIQVHTRLVQVDVIVRDKAGPIANLTKDDFVVLDQGKPQKIGIFSAESSESAAQPAQPLPQNTFSDLPQYTASSLRSVTIVLLDNLNTLMGNSSEVNESRPRWLENMALANAKAHLIEYIKDLDPKDRVAIYGLSDTLHVLCDFTSDRDRLLTILQGYNASGRTNRDLVEPGALHTPGSGRMIDSHVGGATEDAAAFENQRRASETMAALQAIAGHVANIPGRKNLVWLGSNLPFSGTAIARLLSRAQIAAYPIDGRGLLTWAAIPSFEGPPEQIGAILSSQDAAAMAPGPTGIDTMKKMAEETGGIAFVNSNDLTGAIRKAIEDSAVTYTLGFYVDEASFDGKFHEIRVQVKQPGLNVRYPKGYYALADTPASKDERRTNFLAAIVSPIDSSSIPVEVKVDRVNQPSPNSLTLSGTIDIHDIHLAQSGEMRTGVVDVIILQQDETGKVLSESTDQLNLRFTEEQYSGMLKSGVRFRKTAQPKAGATTLRVLVQDPSTAAIGSLVIPLSQVK